MVGSEGLSRGLRWLQARGPSAFSLLGRCGDVHRGQGDSPLAGRRDRKLYHPGSRVLGLSPKNLLSALFSWQGPILSSLEPSSHTVHSL